jgi:hypothetical protein
MPSFKLDKSSLDFNMWASLAIGLALVQSPSLKPCNFFEEDMPSFKLENSALDFKILALLPIGNDSLAPATG